MSEIRLINIDGTMQRPDGLILPVSLDLPYSLARHLHKPLYSALRCGVESVGSTIRETWSMGDQTFVINCDERFARAEKSLPIGSVRRQDGKEALVFQRIPPLLESNITELIYSPR